MLTPISKRAGRDEIIITSDPAAVDLDSVHAYLRTSYWSEEIPRETVARAIANSIPFSVKEGARQVGFARVVTDLATFAYLADVFVVEAHRRRGLGDWLVESILLHPRLQNLRRFALITRDAGALYERHGFTAPSEPSGYMEIVDREVYRRPRPSA
jgi:GNAT superfamily N-acetyltransferase